MCKFWTATCPAHTPARAHTYTHSAALAQAAALRKSHSRGVLTPAHQLACWSFHVQQAVIAPQPSPGPRSPRKQPLPLAAPGTSGNVLHPLPAAALRQAGKSRVQERRASPKAREPGTAPTAALPACSPAALKVPARRHVRPNPSPTHRPLRLNRPPPAPLADPKCRLQCPTEPVRPRSPCSVPRCPHTHGHAACTPRPVQTPAHTGTPLLHIPWHLRPRLPPAVTLPRPCCGCPAPFPGGHAERAYSPQELDLVLALAPIGHGSRLLVRPFPRAQTLSPLALTAPAAAPAAAASATAQSPVEGPGTGAEPAVLLHRGGGGGGRGLPATQCAEGNTGTCTQRARSGDCWAGSPASDCAGLAAGLACRGGAGAAGGPTPPTQVIRSHPLPKPRLAPHTGLAGYHAGAHRRELLEPYTFT